MGKTCFLERFKLLLVRNFLIMETEQHNSLRITLWACIAETRDNLQ